MDSPVTEDVLAEDRRLYAERVCRKAGVSSVAVRRAFAQVPREQYVGPGPWQIMEMPFTSYRTTPDADPRHLYRDVPVAIDATRLLNNGAPSLVAFLIDALALREGEHVLHVGGGTGYYTAILVEIVGPSGRVTALEIDEGLAARARQNLAGFPSVEVVHADGTTYDAGWSDAILVNAGATHPQPTWLDSLRPGGRLVFPLTGSSASGYIVKVTRHGAEYAARCFFQVTIFPCVGARDVAAITRVDAALAQGQPDAVRSLRRDAHEPEPDCWLHGEGFCLSLRAGR
jgi:protein-L-isoaspartate(D-aspartate) O-methyltransferase